MERDRRLVFKAGKRYTTHPCNWLIFSLLCFILMHHSLLFLAPLSQSEPFISVSFKFWGECQANTGVTTVTFKAALHMRCWKWVTQQHLTTEAPWLVSWVVGMLSKQWCHRRLSWWRLGRGALRAEALPRKGVEASGQCGPPYQSHYQCHISPMTFSIALFDTFDK